MNAMLFWALMMAASIFLIVKSASYAVDSIVRYARKAKLSYYFVGLLVVSLGTSLPELFTGIISAFEGKGSLVLGDAMGATIVDAALVLSMVAILLGRYKITKEEINIPLLRLGFVVALPLILAFDGRFSRLDGALMIFAFLLYYGSSIHGELRRQQIVKSLSANFVFKETFIFGVNLALLAFGAQILVLSASNLSHIMNIPLYLFGAVFLAICTTSPEFIVELRAILSKSTPMAFGDIFGSIICNTSLVIGVSALIRPAVIESLRSFYLVGGFMLASVLLALLFIRSGTLRRIHGFALLGLYALFIAVQLYFFVA